MKDTCVVVKYLRACDRIKVDPQQLRNKIVLPELSRTECKRVAAKTNRDAEEVYKLCRFK